MSITKKIENLLNSFVFSDVEFLLTMETKPLTNNPIPKISLEKEGTCGKNLLNSYFKGETEKAIKTNPVNAKFQIGNTGEKNQHFYAHRLILSLSSPFFRKLFYPMDWQTNKKHIWKVVIDDLSPNSFCIILNYIYTGQVELNADTCVSVLSAAKKFELLELCTLAEQYIIQNLKPKIFIQLFQELGDCINCNLKKLLKNYFISNYQAILTTPNSINNIPQEYLSYIMNNQEKAKLLKNENFFKRLFERIDYKNYKNNQSITKYSFKLEREKFLSLYNYNSSEIYQLYSDLKDFQYNIRSDPKPKINEQNQIKKISDGKPKDSLVEHQINKTESTDLYSRLQKPTNSFYVKQDQTISQQFKSYPQKILNDDYKRDNDNELLDYPENFKEQFLIKKNENTIKNSLGEINNNETNCLLPPKKSIVDYSSNMPITQFLNIQQLGNIFNYENTFPKKQKISPIQDHQIERNQNNQLANEQEKRKSLNLFSQLKYFFPLNIPSPYYLNHNRRKRKFNNYQILLLTTDYNESHIDDVICSIKSGGFGNVEQINCSKATPTYEDICKFDCIFIYSTIKPFNDSLTLGNILADYVDDGGGLVVSSYRTMIKNPFKWKNSTLAGRIMSPGYLPCKTGKLVSLKRARLGEIVHKENLIINDIENFDGGTKSYRILTKFYLDSETQGQLIAKWSDGIPLIAWKRKTQAGSGTVVFLNFQPVSGNCYKERGKYSHWLNVDGRKIISNSVRWTLINK
ncbi:pep-cterm sorting domain-containing protein [Anaeramoeba flamelloides]|uniref:Pep-cterm sorting domain-containing protein n=1 Tax=Anaeramoeba flamelloides TaxID=1746091 RepID=A0ABQ8YSJ2_9EUKA|nr:pep-cterm sorting domain-containing protein [Anaeramoeba flamelloides]